MWQPYPRTHPGLQATGTPTALAAATAPRNGPRPAFAAALPARLPVPAGFATFATTTSTPAHASTEPAATAPAEGGAGAHARGGADAAAGDAPTHGSAPVEGGRPGPSAELLVRRGQLLDSLAACLGIHQLDSLLANDRNREAFDEMLLIAALDTTHRLHSNTAAATAAAAAAAASPFPPAAVPPSSGLKTASDAATDVLTRLSELLIQLLSEPGALSPEGAIRALRTLAMMRFNPAGDVNGLMTMSAFYRDAVLPALDPARAPAPELALRAPLLLVDLYFTFARLFEVAARRDRELQAALQAQQAREDEQAARSAADEEAGDGAGRAAAGSQAQPPQGGWEAVGASQRDAVLGDAELYTQLGRLLVEHGMLQQLPSKTLGMLATAIAASGHYDFALREAVCNQTVRRLATAAAAAQGGGGAAADGFVPVSAVPGSDVMAVSTLANIVYSMAKVRHSHETLYDAAAHWVLARLQPAPGGPSGGGGAVAAAGTPGGGRVEVHHIVDMAVAFARVKYDNLDFLLRAADVLPHRLAQASSNSVSMMAWALASSVSGRSPRFEPLLSALCHRMVSLWKRSRVGRTAASSPSSSPSSPSAAASPAAAIAAAYSSTVLPRHLACIAYAAGRLDLRPPGLAALLDVVAADVEARPDEYQSRQLCNVLVAFQRLQSYRPSLFDAACRVLCRRLELLRPHSWEAAAEPHLYGPACVFGPQNYADAAWAVALAGHSGEEEQLMRLLADRVVETAANLGKACLVRAAQAFAVADIRDPRVFEALAQAAQPQLMELGPPYQAMLVDAFAEVQHEVTEEFWLACLDAVGIKMPHLESRAERPDMQAAAAQLAAAFGRHPATQQFPRCRDHPVLQQLAELTAGTGQLE